MSTILVVFNDLPSKMDYFGWVRVKNLMQKIKTNCINFIQTRDWSAHFAFSVTASSHSTYYTSKMSYFMLTLKCFCVFKRASFLVFWRNEILQVWFISIRDGWRTKLVLTKGTLPSLLCVCYSYLTRHFLYNFYQISCWS